MRPDSFLRLWLCISHLLTYSYLLNNRRPRHILCCLNVEFSSARNSSSRRQLIFRWRRPKTAIPGHSSIFLSSWKIIKTSPLPPSSSAPSGSNCRPSVIRTAAVVARKKDLSWEIERWSSAAEGAIHHRGRRIIFNPSYIAYTHSGIARCLLLCSSTQP